MDNKYYMKTGHNEKTIKYLKKYFDKYCYNSDYEYDN